MLSINSTRKPYKNQPIIDFSLSFVADLSLLYYLERTEPLNFELYRVKLRKALRLTLTGFKAMRGAV